MNKRRILVWTYCAVLAWVIVDIYLMEVKKRGELVALCAGFEGKGKTIALTEAHPSARAVIEFISAAAGIAPNFSLFQADDVPTIAFAAIKDGQRIIVFDSKAFQWEDRAATWRAAVVAAHEVAHHLGGHITTPVGEVHARELEADQFSGQIISLLGGSLAQALSFSEIFPEIDSQTHPARARRRDAITRGWMRGETFRRTGKLAP